MTAMRRRNWRWFWLVVVAAIAIVFFGDTRPTAEEVRADINSELAVGADSKAIEQFFARHKIAYGYDRYRDRYEGIIRNPRYAWFLEHAILVDVNVDKERKFLSSEVSDSYTFL
jgi:hypothetical protein